MRRKRFQKGSLQTRKHGRHRMWVAFWWEDGERRCKTLARHSQLTKSEAEAVLSGILREMNSVGTRMARPVFTFEQFTKEVYLPFCRRSWKESTAGTSEQIIGSHLVPESTAASNHSASMAAARGGTATTRVLPFFGASRSPR
jgi:hypothetical protein